ncbi:MAG: ribokinase [Vicinamibacteraceae bacterium]
MTVSPGIVVVGSLNIDLVTRVERLPLPGETLTAEDFEIHCGGKGANQAYAAAKLGGHVTLVGCVGSDAYGRQLLENLARAGVEVGAVDLAPDLPSGMALVTVDPAGENQIVVVPGANEALTPARLEHSRALFSSAAVVLLQLEVPLPTVEAAARLGREAGALVILDPAPARPLPDALLSDVDYVTPNVTELTALTASAVTISRRAHELLDRGVRGVIVTLGEQGAELVTRGREHHWQPRPTPVVDTTGAGDTFNAALAVALTRGADIDQAGDFACAAASLSVVRRGAQSSMPTADEVMAHMRPRNG